jgi:hypothetical protein
MSQPQVILSGDYGEHNRDLKRAAQRVKGSKVYRNLSTVCVVPSRGSVPIRCVDAWMGLQTPMNQPFVRMMLEGFEVGEAYERAIDLILEHEVLKTFKYLLTLEEDNLPPPDGLLRLYESIDEYAVVAGLYWTKGEGGMPMIYGDPKGILAFNPQVPKPNVVQECNGVGMGFTLFDMRLFTDGKIGRPFFKTVSGLQADGTYGMATQDLFFMGNARRAGYRVASDNRVRVGHLDPADGRVW